MKPAVSSGSLPSVIPHSTPIAMLSYLTTGVKKYPPGVTVPASSDPIYALPIISPLRCNLHSHFLCQDPAQKSSNAVRLPSRERHQVVHGCALRSLQQLHE